MKERLDLIQERYNFLCDELLKPEIYEDYKKMQTISKEKNSIEGIVKAYKKYKCKIIFSQKGDVACIYCAFWILCIARDAFALCSNYCDRKWFF